MEDVPELEPLPDESELKGKNFGEILLAFKLAHRDDVEDAVEEQQKMASLGKHTHIGEILLKKEIITTDEIVKILLVQGRLIYRCDTCSLLASKSESRSAARLSCPRCLGRLRPQKEDFSTDEAIAVVDLDKEKQNPLIGKSYKDFRIAREYSKNLLSTIFIGEQESLERRVGITVLNEKMAIDTAAKGSFLADSRSAAKLSFHSIAAGIDIGEIDGSPCYIFDFPDGHSVEDYVAQKGFLPAQTACKIAMQAAHALKFCQERKKFHGNLSPSKVFVSTGSSVTLIDVGFPHTVELEYSISLPTGNPAFFAPEVIGGKQPDDKSDQFALGALLYYMVTGTPPSKGNSWMDISAGILALEPQPISILASDFDSKLEAVINKMLEKNPENRYESMDDLLNTLAPYAGMKHDIPLDISDAEVPEPIAKKRARRPRRRR